MASGTSSDAGSEGSISPLRVLAAGTSWRLFGSQRAAETLLRAASGSNEQNRMLAGMSLVKAGQRSFDLIENRLETGKASAPLVRLLPDIDSDRALGLLRKIAKGERGEMRETARQCIDLIDRMDALDDER